MPGPPRTGGRYRIEALAKGLKVLRLFDDEVRSLRLSDISSRTGIALPTVFRVVATLEEFGYLERLADGSVCPGLSVLSLGTAALRGSSLLEAGDRPMRRLADASGETVNLGVLTQDRVLYVARLRGSDLVTANVQVGSTLPAVRTSIGKLLLAYIEPGQLGRIVGPASFPKSAGPNAICTFEALEPELQHIRERGFAIQDEELAVGLRSVAVPVFGSAASPVAGLNVAVSTARHSVNDLVNSFLGPLRSAAREISMRLESR